MVGNSYAYLYKTKYLYCQNQYPKLWIGKCHTPIAQRLENSACHREIVGSSPTKICYFPLYKIRLVQEQLFTANMGWPRMVGFSYVNLYKTKYSYRHSQFPKLWIGKCRGLESHYERDIFYYIKFDWLKNNCSQSKWLLLPAQCWNFVC